MGDNPSPAELAAETWRARRAARLRGVRVREADARHTAPVEAGRTAGYEAVRGELRGNAAVAALNDELAALRAAVARLEGEVGAARAALVEETARRLWAEERAGDQYTDFGPWDDAPESIREEWRDLAREELGWVAAGAGDGD